MKKLYIASLAALVTAAPAAAQDFSGFRGEIRGGYDRLNIEAGGSESHEDGVAYGAEIGYDFAASRGFVVGVYGGVDMSEVGDCVVALGNDAACAELGRNFTAGARVGGVVGGNAMIYAKGGYSNGRISTTYENFGNLFPSFSNSDTFDGIHLGAGAEIGFGSNAYGKIEYVYTDYSTATLDFGFAAFAAEFNRHQVLVGAGLRF